MATSPAGNGGTQQGIGTPAGGREHVKARERMAAARGVARARVWVCAHINLRPWRLGAARRSEGELRHEHGLRDAALLRGCEQVVVREGI